MDLILFSEQHSKRRKGDRFNEEHGLGDLSTPPDKIKYGSAEFVPQSKLLEAAK